MEMLFVYIDPLSDQSTPYQTISAVLCDLCQQRYLCQYIDIKSYQYFLVKTIKSVVLGLDTFLTSPSRAILFYKSVLNFESTFSCLY